MKSTKTPQNTSPKIVKKRGGWKVLTVVLGVFVLIILAALISYSRNRNVYARLGNTTVTNDQYTAALTAYKSYGEKTGQKSITDDVAGYTKAQLALDLSLRNNADKYNINYSQAILDSYMLEKNTGLSKITNVPAESRINAARETLKAQYGWDDEAINRNFRIAFLKDKLQSKLLSYRDVLQIMTRWDYAEGTTGYSAAQADKAAKESIEQKILPLVQKKAKTEDILKSADNVEGREVAFDKFSPSTTIALVHKQASVENAQGVGFQDANEWKAIYNLNNIGDYTPVTRSDAGYYYIDRLEGKSTGNYKTWEDYQTQAQKAVVFYKSGFDVQKILPNFGSVTPAFSITRAKANALALCKVSDKVSLKDKTLRILLGARAANAACPGGLGIQHTFTFGGNVYNNVLQPQSGVSVQIVNRGDLPVCGPAGTVEDYTVPGTTDGSGYWETGAWNGNPFNQPGSSLRGRGFSCFMHWDAIFTIGSCQVRQPIGTPTGANGVNIRFGVAMPCAAALPSSIVYLKVDDSGGESGDTDFKNARVWTDRFVNNTPNLHIYDRPGTNGGATELDMYALTNDTNPAIRYNFLVDQVPSNWSVSKIESCGDVGNCNLSNFVNGSKFQQPNGVMRYFIIHFTPVSSTPSVKLYVRSPDPAAMNDPLPPFALYQNPANPFEVDQGVPLQLWWKTNNVNTCRSPLAFPGSAWRNLSRSLAPAKPGVNVSADTTNPRTIDYQLSCKSNDDGSTITAHAYVKVVGTILTPWLQTVNGDVLAFGAITGQVTDQDGGRQSSDSNKEAEYVVIASLNANWTTRSPKGFATVNPTGQTAIQNFCSSVYNRTDNSYEFGNRNGGDSIETACSSGPYVANIPDEFFNPTNSGDMIVAGLLRSLAIASNPDNGAVCSINRPYKVGDQNLDPNASSLGGIFNDSATGDCPTIYGLNNSNRINGIANNKGRATIYVRSNLRISGNIINNFGSYSSANDVPNLGIIVNGNVDIDESVTRIDAAIYATGQIRTCREYGSSGTSCRTQLVVHGALAAKGGFIFGRAFADEGTHAPAEQIITNGSFLLAPPPGFEDRYSESIRRTYNNAESVPRFKTNG